ncbi:DMT superfamily inner membrane transporter protein [Rhizobium phaseoli]|nr:DMT superfamily inner membrane transporter protein [Rhizobium phaseoli]
MVGLTPTGVTGEGKPHEKPSHELAALGAPFRRLRSTHGDFRQGRRREREFRFRDLHSHHRHPTGGGNDDLCDRQLAGAISVSGRTWLFLVLSGLATGASWICYFRALKLGDAARVAPIDKLSVVFVAVFAVLFLGERLTLPNWLGIVMIAGGAVLIAYRA